MQIICLLAFVGFRFYVMYIFMPPVWQPRWDLMSDFGSDIATAEKSEMLVTNLCLGGFPRGNGPSRLVQSKSSILPPNVLPVHCPLLFLTMERAMHEILSDNIFGMANLPMGVDVKLAFSKDRPNFAGIRLVEQNVFCVFVLCV